jgi:hypothetical protein
LDELDSIPREKTWTRDELEELKTYYKEKINAISNGRGVVARESDPRVSVLEVFEDI